jgi:DtxR family Mn-dependent transcriptional regulator
MPFMHVSELPERSQDYLKKIYDLQEWENRGASLSTLADQLGQRRSTASEAVKRLAADGMVNHAPYGDITLTPEGKRLALQMVRRHRLLETFLMNRLGYGRDEVHNEAEVLEHAVSDLFVERIDAALGFPDRDPHGDPIPDADGVINVPDTVALSSAGPGDRLVIDRISDRDPGLLRYLEDHGILPGTEVEVRERPYPEMAAVRIGDADVQLSAASLDAIRCRTAEAG